MGQKVNPNGMRLGIIRDWDANWYEDKGYADFLSDDLRIRHYIDNNYASAAISRVLIERQANKPMVTIYCGRPGVLLGRKGTGRDEIVAKLSSMLGIRIRLQIEEVKRIDLDATLLAANVAQQLERRAMFRRVIKRAVQTAMRAGAKGVKVAVGGRLGGAEIARTEWHREGQVPLHTFRADIDYGTARASTTYGIIGVKVWIYKGEILTGKDAKNDEESE
jgi:small subunit ribosomal protein S3